MTTPSLSRLPFVWFMGLRSTLPSKSVRKDGFATFVSCMSVLSIAVGVMALIVVLSVMNGFQKEVRDKMLSVLPHAEVTSFVGALRDPQQLQDDLSKSFPEIIGAAPYVRGQGLLSSGRSVKGTLISGVDPDKEPQVSGIPEAMIAGKLSDLKPGQFGVVLGNDLARQLGVRIGDKVTLMIPQGQYTPAGTMPRMRQFTVTGLFSSGHYEFDSSMSLVHIKDAQTLYRLKGPAGLRLKLSDMHQAPQIAAKIRHVLPPGLLASDWSRQNAAWFAAVQVEKRMMGIILFLIVLVGAFGLVSSLVMAVTSRRAEIAILRTLGATRGEVMRIFLIQGMLTGVLGVFLGCVFGLLIACNVQSIVSFIEYLFNVEFLPREIYFISTMPSDPRASDIVPIALFSLLLALVSAVYPSWRAAKIDPAEALRYE